MSQKFRIYTDGSCLGNPGPGGWAAIILDHQGQTREYFGHQDNTTNNQMELNAAIQGLKEGLCLDPHCSVTLLSDSQYMRLGITQWIHQWKRNGWRTADRKSVKNQELWKKLDELNQRMTIEWCWVKGHNGDFYNERADHLAQQAAQKPTHREPHNE